MKQAVIVEQVLFEEEFLPQYVRVELCHTKHHFEIFGG